MTMTLPALPYASDALMPHMSPETFEYHHGKHHQAYVDNGNKLVAGSEYEGRSMEEIIAASFGKNPGVFNNVAQVFNHNFFWNSMKPSGGGGMPEKLAAMVNESFGGFEQFREAFVQGGMTQFGSGWVWLVLKNDKLEIMKTPNAENPLVHGATPLITCDVWEHAYYIDYRNARPKFLETFVDSLANWEFAEANLASS